MRDYKGLLEAGNKAQLEKLKKYKNKKGFETISVDNATNRINDELSELQEEVWAITNNGGCINYWYKVNKDYTKIRHEAADIANFAHMIILACDKELTK